MFKGLFLFYFWVKEAGRKYGISRNVSRKRELLMVSIVVSKVQGDKD